MKFEKTDCLDRYFKSIKNLNPLTKEEELELAVKAQSGDTHSIEKLVKHNLKIVITIANKNRGRGIGVDDLIQQGNLGLYEAALRFDPTHNVRFATFAGTRVLKSINKLIDDSGRIVRIPVNQEYQRYLDKKNGKDVENISSVKLDDFVGDEEKGQTKGDVIASTRPEVEETIDYDHYRVKVTSLLNVLKERDREIIKMFFGIDQDEPIPTKDIAKEMGLTQIRVCQIISSSKKRLKEEVQ